MKLIDRHILTSLVAPLFFCLVAFYCLFIVIDLFDTLPDAIKNKAGWGALAQFYLIPAPMIFQSVAPAAYFLAVTTVLVAWSSTRELVAVLTAGTSLARVSIPFFLIGLGVMVVQYFLFIEWSPKTDAWRIEMARKMQKNQSSSQVFRSVIYKNSASGALWFAQEIDLRNKTVKQAEILLPDDLGRDRLKIFAARGEYKDGYWDFAGVRKVEFNRDGSSLPPQDLPTLQTPFLNETPRQLVAVMSPASGMTWPELREFLKTAPSGSTGKNAPYRTENLYRLAYPLVCPILCLFAFGLAVNFDRRNKATAVFQCLLVLGGLILCLEFFKAMGNAKRLNPWMAAWSPVFLFGTAGLWLFAERVGWLWDLRHFIHQGQTPLPISNANSHSGSDPTPSSPSTPDDVFPSG
ncbi:MAG: LptF/LptG family permease [Candidatus Methylacidiphilales bacterium]|nr:LptF/LptG family permease [Candidatus Methylacidiphilales bacterium]